MEDVKKLRVSLDMTSDLSRTPEEIDEDARIEKIILKRIMRKDSADNINDVYPDLGYLDELRENVLVKAYKQVKDVSLEKYSVKTDSDDEDEEAEYENEINGKYSAEVQELLDEMKEYEDEIKKDDEAIQIFDDEDFTDFVNENYHQEVAEQDIQKFITEFEETGTCKTEHYINSLIETLSDDYLRQFKDEIEELITDQDDLTAQFDSAFQIKGEIRRFVTKIERNMPDGFTSTPFENLKTNFKELCDRLEEMTDQYEGGTFEDTQSEDYKLETMHLIDNKLGHYFETFTSQSDFFGIERAKISSVKKLFGELHEDVYKILDRKTIMELEEMNDSLEEKMETYEEMSEKVVALEKTLTFSSWTQFKQKYAPILEFCQRIGKPYDTENYFGIEEDGKEDEEDEEYGVEYDCPPEHLLEYYLILKQLHDHFLKHASDETIEIREIGNEQGRTDLVIPRLRFKLLVQDILNEYKSNACFDEEAIDVLHEASQDYLQQLYEGAVMAGVYRGYDETHPKDIMFTRRMRGEIN